jgi:hypothetical protein
MYIYVFECIHVYIDIRTYMHVNILIHICDLSIFMAMYVRIHIHVNKQVYLCWRINSQAYICVEFCLVICYMSTVSFYFFIIFEIFNLSVRCVLRYWFVAPIKLCTCINIWIHIHIYIYVYTYIYICIKLCTCINI